VLVYTQKVADGALDEEDGVSITCWLEEELTPLLPLEDDDCCVALLKEEEEELALPPIEELDELSPSEEELAPAPPLEDDDCCVAPLEEEDGVSVDELGVSLPDDELATVPSDEDDDCCVALLKEEELCVSPADDELGVSPTDDELASPPPPPLPPLSLEQALNVNVMASTKAAVSASFVMGQADPALTILFI